jgi:hypothetical protein
MKHDILLSTSRVLAFIMAALWAGSGWGFETNKDSTINGNLTLTKVAGDGGVLTVGSTASITGALTVEDSATLKKGITVKLEEPVTSSTDAVSVSILTNSSDSGGSEAILILSKRNVTNNQPISNTTAVENYLTLDGGLRVEGVSDYTVAEYRYISKGDGVGASLGSNNKGTTSIYAESRLTAQEIMIFSDSRIKKNLSTTDNREDLDKLNQLQVTDYQYIDVVGRGSQQQKKLIAQQVEKIYPEAVTRSEGFIPNIYKPSVLVSYDEDKRQLEVEMDVKHGLTQGAEVRLITDIGKRDYKVVEVVDNYSFVVASDQPLSTVFVFGIKVDDFRQVDYDAISMLSVSAIQQLSKENDMLKAKTAQLEQVLKECLERLNALEHSPLTDN